MKKINRDQESFTLIEIMISIIIIVIMSATISAGFLDRKDEISLFLFRGELISDLRFAQVKSINSANNFGIFIESTNRYVFFEDLNQNNSFDAGEKVRYVILPEGTTFTSVSINRSLLFRKDGSLFGGVDISLVITNNVINENILINSIGLIN